MRIVNTPDEFHAQLESARRESLASFSDDRVLLERYVTNPRHVEFQVFADTHGNAVHLFERDCSVQRRHQKVLEEAPAPGMTTELRNEMGDAAVAAAKAVGYVGAGTVEFILEPSGEFFFMEMNTRLQVEHPVTEMVTRQDLVEWQLKIASGQTLPLEQKDLSLHGHSIEARIYAENPRNGFLPGSGTCIISRTSSSFLESIHTSSGTVKHLNIPTPSCSFDNSHDVRVDSGVVQGGEVSVHYDPMIAKLIVAAEDRPAALKKMLAALRQYHIVGLPTNIDFVQACCAHPAFEKGGVDTGFIDENVDRLLPPTSDARPETVALAALSCTMKSTSSTSEDQDPWNTLKHFRSASDLESKVMLTDDEGKEREITFTHASTGRILANVDGEHDIVVSRVEMNEDDVIKAELDGHVVTASTVFDKSDRSVHLFYSGPPDKNSKSPDQCYFQFGVPADAYVWCFFFFQNGFFELSHSHT